ncbi:DUF6303 family protein [Streptomyces sp. NPDC000594]|uniref:DUF6303 family protein n=1 Tax=Streptomyces sp. NPDC000594 TaxID=3154261 RepID=UPI00332DAD40
MTLFARLTNSLYAGHWELYIPSADDVSVWPEHEFRRAYPLPTLAERLRVLRDLGYEPVPGSAWRWDEDPAGPNDRVELTASIPVRPQDEGVS